MDTRAKRASAAGKALLRRRHAYRRALPVALVASALIHAVVLTVPLHRDVPATVDARAPERGVPVPERGIRLIDIRPFPSAEAPPPADVDRTHTPPRVAPVRAVSPPTEAGLPEASAGSSVAASLRPRLSDPRIWSRPAAVRTERARAERQRLIERAEEVAERTAGIRIPTAGNMSARTGRDESGDRWGLSPGALHLGGITVPLCSGDFDASNCGFGVPPAFRERYRNDVRALVALRLQGDRSGMESRARAIRTRLDSLRDPIASQNR